MKNLTLITVLILLFAACDNIGTNKEKLKEEVKEELKKEMQKDAKNEQNQETNTGDFEWEGTYKYNGQTVTFKPDGAIKATGDFPYYRYKVQEKNKCNMNIINLVYMGIVEFHYKRKGNTIELYHLDLNDCKVKELYGVLEKQ